MRLESRLLLRAWKLTGELKDCQSCGETKAKSKSIKKTTDTRASKPGGCILIDLSGLFPRGMGGGCLLDDVCG